MTSNQVDDHDNHDRSRSSYGTNSSITQEMTITTGRAAASQRFEIGYISLCATIVATRGMHKRDGGEGVNWRGFGEPL